MKILFPAENALASVELKSLLGFTDKDLKFDNLKSDIIAATNEIIKLIGKPTYDLAVSAYEKINPTQDDQDFFYAVRYPIALQGYRLYAPNNDLSHTNKGRITRIEDKEQAPFQWMIHADNVALERKYYSALDALIKYLDDYEPTWKDTDAYKDTHKLFIRTVEDFDEFFPIGDSRLLLIKLSPGIRLAEKRHIKPIIGKDLFDEMKAKLKTDVAVDTDLHDKIKEALVYKAMAWAMRRLSVQLFPEGVLQSFVSDRLVINSKRPSLKSETEGAAQHFDKDADFILNEIEAIITAQQIVEPNPDAPPPLSFECDADDGFISTT